MTIQPLNSEESKNNSLNRDLKFASFISFTFCNREGQRGEYQKQLWLQQCGKFKQNMIARCVFSAKRKLCLVSSQVGCHHYKRSGEKESYTPAQTENKSSQYAYIWKVLQNQLLQWLPTVGVLSKTC